MAGPLIVEHLGVVVDDGGRQMRTLVEVITAAGLHPRPGATEALAGACAEHAVATLLLGHGRDVDPALVGAVEERWVRDLRAGLLPLRAGAAERLTVEVGRRPVHLVGNLPAEAVLGSITGALPGIQVSRGARGLPHPDAILDVAAGQGGSPSDLTVLAHSPAMLLAAAQAGVTDLVLVGQTSARWSTLVPVTACIDTLAAWAPA